MRAGNGPYSQNEASKKGYIQFTLSLPPDLHEKMVKEGNRRGLNRMSFIRLIIAEAVQKK